MEVGPRYVSPFPVLQSNTASRPFHVRTKIKQNTQKTQTNEWAFTNLWWDLGGVWSALGTRRSAFGISGAFLQVAVLPADSGVCSVTPGSSVSVRVPAQIPPEVPVQIQNLGVQLASDQYPTRFYILLLD